MVEESFRSYPIHHLCFVFLLPAIGLFCCNAYHLFPSFGGVRSPETTWDHRFHAGDGLRRTSQAAADLRSEALVEVLVSFSALQWRFPVVRLGCGGGGFGLGFGCGGGGSGGLVGGLVFGLRDTLVILNYEWVRMGHTFNKQLRSPETTWDHRFHAGDSLRRTSQAAADLRSEARRRRWWFSTSDLKGLVAVVRLGGGGGGFGLGFSCGGEGLVAVVRLGGGDGGFGLGFGWSGEARRRRRWWFGWWIGFWVKEYFAAFHISNFFSILEFMYMLNSFSRPKVSPQFFISTSINAWNSQFHSNRLNSFKPIAKNHVKFSAINGRSNFGNRKRTINVARFQYLLPRLCTSSSTDHVSDPDSDSVSDSDSDSDSENRISVIVWFAITLLLGVTNRVLHKLALVPMKDYPFFLAQFNSFVYVAVYFSVLHVRHRAGITTDEMLAIPKTPFVMIGFLESVAIIFGMYSGAMLPGPVIPLLYQTLLVWQLVFSSIFLKRNYSLNQLVGCFLVAAGVVVAVTSGSNTGQLLSGVRILWPALMIAACAFQAGASIVKEYVFLDAATRFKGKLLDDFIVNSFGSGFQALFILLFLPILSSLKSIPLSELPLYFKSGAACFLNIGINTTGCDGAPLLPLLYIVSNIFFNISMLNLLKFSNTVFASLAVSANFNICSFSTIAISSKRCRIESLIPLGLSNSCSGTHHIQHIMASDQKHDSDIL
ncbi:hypothetical protein RD792_000623 [Penstemon davidsonii]|uniref:Uncharacterized protein n=1 Tax=Penstemon davidsonii TaxID=160366 RepID=A0ABR0DL56_9LAMI|nr:hypothetical protein RD792_000623 [Penstemon davidsonii]